MRPISIGTQGYEFLRREKCFYIDKTDFIREWWDSKDAVTLLTRPRRFGKTLNMDMLNCFFSNRYADRSELFEGLSIWQYEEYRNLQGTYPVIFLSFADVKETEADDAIQRMVEIVCSLYGQYEFLLDSEFLSDMKKQKYKDRYLHLDASMAVGSLKYLSELLYEHFGKKVVILLDEYDTPMQEAYVHGYWEEMVSFIRSLFNSTFKTNPNLERAFMTGITRVSKESIFSGLNNLKVITTTSEQYMTAFGFTEEEVFASLDEYGLSEQKEMVKKWYDGFTFGTTEDVYNPWSITNFLKDKKFATYWANSSSNSIIGKQVQYGQNEIKQTMEKLLEGESLDAIIDEEIIFDQLDYDRDAIWSLMLASGYLKIDGTDTDPENFEVTCHLKLTNYEVKLMFEKMFANWFKGKDVPYNQFIAAMQKANLEEMNIYMSEILKNMVSSFDIGNQPSDKAHPERFHGVEATTSNFKKQNSCVCFYHGLVLGLMATERKYQVISNGESGYGRYDVMMIPKNTEPKDMTAFVLEFKIFDEKKEQTLEDTVQRALEQIKEKEYDSAILGRGIERERIRHFGFGFQGKSVLIGMDRL